MNISVLVYNSFQFGKNWKVFFERDIITQMYQLAPSIENIDKLIVFCVVERSFGEMLSFMNYTDRTKFRRKYIQPLLEDGVLEHTIPDKPNSKNQKYRLTEKGLKLKQELKNKNNK